MTALVNQEKSLRPLVIASRKGSRLKRPNARSCAGGVAGPSTAQLAKCASCFAQDDEFWGWVGESGRASLDTPPFAKCAKGRAPRLCGNEGEPIQGFFSSLRMTRFVVVRDDSICGV